ncbi:antitoxin Xre-like helix-turn-helix domain-containing protein [Pseudomonas jessenii]|uniref:antitoxin Xre-like helix-turn-helix domain-containing protein n=1 Tax=Pseudomonas jessenii TaxID=77298 RepID=UPI0015F0830D
MKADIWTALKSPASGVEIHGCVRIPPPFEWLDQLADILQMNREMLATCLGVSPKTLSRGAQAGHFSGEERERLNAFIAVLQAASGLFGGDIQAVGAFLSSPVRGLHSRTPLEMLVLEPKSMRSLI